MALGTFSKFYYGYEITTDNKYFDFNEGSGEISIQVTVGIYTPTDLASELEDKLNASGSKTYTVTFNRADRTFTIAADSGTYDILISTGTNTITGIYSILGFTGAADLTGVITYTSDSPTGSTYSPQFWLQDYTAPGEWKEKIDASINEPASGDVELIDFGTKQFTEFSILFITNLTADGKVIKNNPNGVASAKSFLDFAIKKGPLEFMPDEGTVGTFHKVQLESAPGNSKGTGYRLVEETSKKLPGFYSIRKLKWRVR